MFPLLLVGHSVQSQHNEERGNVEEDLHQRTQHQVSPHPKEIEMQVHELLCTCRRLYSLSRTCVYI